MKKRFIVYTFIIGLLSVACKSHKQVSIVKSVQIQHQNNYYVGNRAPLKPLHFIKLPIGNIKPEGWLREVLKRQRDGMTGHLEQISAWLQKKNNAWLNKGDKHGWEEVPYWLRGYSNLGYVLNDSSIVRDSKTWLDAVINGQRKDGYFGPETNKQKNGSYGLWPNMVMLDCLQAYYEYSQDPHVISLMKKYFRWELKVPDDHFLTGYWEKSRGGDNLYSVYWLYNRTGDQWLLKLAKKIHRHTADWEKANGLPNMHNVNIAEGFREPATYGMLSHDSTDMEATYKDFHMIRLRYGQVPGGMFGGDENSRPGYSDPHQAVETCGMVEQMASDEMLLRMTGNSIWATNAENVAFNTYPAAMMPDFKSLRYLTAPNMVISDGKSHNPGVQNGGPMFVMNPLSHRCCQHNHTQGWPYYAENLVMATPDNGLAAVLYSSSVTKAKVGRGTNIKLHEKTHYPFDDSIDFTVSTPKNVSFPLYLILPSWAHKPKVKVNGKTIALSSKKGSYIKINREWADGDHIQLTLPMKISVKRWNKNKNSASVNYGPLTFSLKIDENVKKDNPKKTALSDSKWRKNVSINKWPAYELFPQSPWNYGLVLNNNNPASSLKIEHKKWPDNNFPFTLDSVPLQIKATGKRIPDWTIDKNGLVAALPQSPVKTDKSKESITLVPMGAARLRISEFPVVE